MQILCIERDGMGPVKALNASQLLARSGDGTHFLSLDKVIRTMRDIGRARGGVLEKDGALEHFK